MKMVYLMAIKNVQVGNIEKLLEPIIRGEVMISENPHHIRVQAIWTIMKAVADKVEYTHNLLWPILVDVTQPLNVRIVTYDVLMSQMPNMQRMMNIYWFMIHEQNNHLYNYHYTTLKGLANSVDPCLMPVREMARKVLHFTRMRPVTTHLSFKHFFDYTDPVYEHSASWKNAWVLDEVTGMPLAGYFEHYTSVARKPVDKVGVSNLSIEHKFYDTQNIVSYGSLKKIYICTFYMLHSFLQNLKIWYAQVGYIRLTWIFFRSIGTLTAWMRSWR